MKIILENIVLKPALYLVGTPIGNLQDVTLRCLQTLSAVETVFCEDTRVTGKLLKAFDIKTRMAVYTDHSDEKLRDRIFSKITNEGKAVALVSDAGLPLISDPGFKLVREAIEQNIDVISIPGPSAVLTALQISGLPTDSFTFGGFIPTKQGARENLLQKYSHHTETLVFYETVPRLEKTLETIQNTFGDRGCVVARELTKKFEEVLRGRPRELISRLQDKPIKGEVVLLVKGHVADIISDDDIEKQIIKALRTMTVKEASTSISEKTGVPRKVIYNKALSIKDR